MMRLLKFKLNGFNRDIRRKTASGRRCSVPGCEEKYCIFFVNPEDGLRSEYMHNLSRTEAEQRMYALRFLKLSPFMEKQWEIDEEEIFDTLPARVTYQPQV